MREKIMILLICLSMSINISHSAESYKGNNSTNMNINEWGTCQNVTNNCGSAIFIPTKTSAEWTAFRNFKPACITIGSCVPINCSYTTYQGGACSASCGGGNYATYYTKTVVESNGGTCAITEGQFAGYSGGACNTGPCAPVNGACSSGWAGARIFECNSGTPILLVSGACQGAAYTWSCEGLYGGSTARCSYLDILCESPPPDPCEIRGDC